MRRANVGWAAAVLAAAGCSGSDLQPVSGTVAYRDGSPFPGGRVQFEAAAPGPDGKRHAVGGQIHPDGKFAVGTFKATDGAPVGEYRVSVVPLPPQVALPDMPLPLDPKYTDPERSGLRFEVKPGPNVCELVVDRDPRGKKK